MTAIDEYLKNLTPERRQALERIRVIALDEVPTAEDTISYGIPTMKYKGKYIIYFAAHKDHLSLHGSMSAVDDMIDDHLKSTKGTIQFTPETPIAEEVIRAFVRNRVKEIDAK